MTEIEKLLSLHFGITRDYCEDGLIPQPVPEDADFFKTELTELGIADTEGTLAGALGALTAVIRQSPAMFRPLTREDLCRMMIRRDLLRLYVFCSQMDAETNLTLRSGKLNIRLGNCGDWTRVRLFRPFLAAEMPDVANARQARAELEAVKPVRGRRANDIRIPILLWGAYEMLSCAHRFRTPMPNVLCEFLIRMLQRMSVLPEETDIDTLWIRAQLRYLRGRKEKARGQSNIMNGAQ